MAANVRTMERDTARRSRSAVPVSIELPAGHRAIALIRLGNTVREWLPSRDHRHALRAVSRTTPAESDTGVVSGNAQKVAS